MSSYESHQDLVKRYHALTKERKRVKKNIHEIEVKDIRDTLAAKGYAYIPESEIKKIDDRRPDFVLSSANNSFTVLGERKSALEPPTTPSWRTQRPDNDIEEFTKLRAKVRNMEKEKPPIFPKRIGGHIIIIEGQIQDYSERFPTGLMKSSNRNLPAVAKFAYAVPKDQKQNVLAAFAEINKHFGKNHNLPPEHHEGSIMVTFIFDKSDLIALDLLSVP